MALVAGRWLAIGVLGLASAAACGESSSKPSSGGAEAGEGGAQPSPGGAGGSDANLAGAGGEDITPGGTAGASVNAGAGAGGVDDPGGSAGAAGAGGEVASLPGDQVFASTSSVLEVRLELDDDDWTDLEEHGNLENYVPGTGTVKVAGGPSATFAKLGVRHKGAWSLHHCWDNNGGVRSYLLECEKLSYKLKFDEYTPDGRYDGLKRLNLHASSGDPSKLRELLAYQTFRDAGIDAPRAMPARLYINGEFQGLFIAVEDIDGRYVQAHYPDAPEGNLYKEIWPNSQFSDDDFAAALETNEDAADVSDMREFAAAITTTDEASFLQDVAPHVEVGTLLRYVAVDRMLRNWDGITAFYSPLTPHNFYWYHDSNDGGRFHLVPWDLDNTFGANDPYMYPAPWQQIPGVPDITVEPLNCQPRVVWTADSGTYITPPRCDKFLDLLMRTSFEGFAAAATALRKTALSPNHLQALADHYEPLIAPIVAQDPTLNASEWALAVAELPGIFADSAASLDALVAAGLVKEQEPPPDPDEPTQEELDATTLDAGLHVGGITNFEFAEPPAGAAPLGVEVFGDPLATYLAKWNTSLPLSGKADLHFDFTFSRGPLAYDEWVNVATFTAEADVTTFKGITVWLASNKQRKVRIRVWSPAYDDTFGGIWSEFGVDRFVGPTPTAVKVDFADLIYPDYARAPWTPSQGFPGTDEEAKALVLSRFQGLIFAPEATFDGTGELASETETGWLRVDNIYFR